MTERKLPADHDVRQRVIHDLDTSFFLEAGAGTGKTSVLVARVVEMARRGTRLDRIVAITFTEKAAGELRERIRRELATAGLTEAVREIEAAQISTVHAFAATLLRERALDAGLDPNFRVLDQLQTDLRFQRSWRAWLWSDAPPAAQAAIQRALSLGLELRDLQAMGEHMSRNRDLDLAPPDEEDLQLPEEIGRLAREAQALVAGCARLAPVSLDAAERLLAELRQSDGTDRRELGRRLAGLDFRGAPAGRDPDRAELRDRWFALRDARDVLVDRIRDETLAELATALSDFVREDALQRRSEGVLSYDDLLLEARDLLVRHDAARRALRVRFDSILVDEFQDTDPLQAEIVLLLAAAEETANWREAEPGPGRLMLVGDPKQSIYRFRRADIDTYEEVKEVFRRTAKRRPETAAIERLRVNFRARPHLGQWQNRSLDALLRPDSAYPRAQASFQPIEPDREESGGGVVSIPSGSEHQRIGEAREAEAKLIARLVAHLVEGRSELGQIVNGDGSRPPTYREIAILVRTRTGIADYTRELTSAGIPYHFDSGQGFYERPEIRAAAHLLRAFDDPTDEVAALAVLKSPLVAASDQELFEFVHCGSGDQTRILLNPESVPEEYDGRFREQIEALWELRTATRDLPLPQLVEHVIRESGLLEAQVLSRSNSAERQANLRMLVQRAHDFAASEADSLRPFVRWLSQRQSRNLPESESPTSEADEDAVRILTIHQAKGLEFPVVILPKLSDRPFGTTRFIVDRPNQRVAYRIGREQQFATPGMVEAELRDDAYADAEARRMLYVACTRAQDWLIFSSFPARSTGSAETFHSFLDQAAPGWLAPGADADLRVLGPGQFDALRAQRPPEIAVAHAELKQQWQRLRGEALARGNPRKVARTPSGLAGDLGKVERESVLIEEESEGEAGLDGALEPLLVGRAIHAALELADFDDAVVTEQRTRRICVQHDLELEMILEHVNRAIQSDLLQRARLADEVHRELPLTTIRRDGSGGTTITEGVADLVFRESDRWVLIDYKSDREIPDERLRGYSTQVQTYAEMLDAIGIRVSEAWLLLTSTGESIPVSLG